jgi:hypothetical protein
MGAIGIPLLQAFLEVGLEGFRLVDVSIDRPGRLSFKRDCGQTAA